ncbi:RimK/LysX family protein [Photobacterium gaetbulicola]|uniref:putative ATP-dependent zinc protease n=1 Tax=Photobacterium gaetbulicola TaxID=1295392 RepID=UPI0006918625|nr:RimK/LysX family protein [Photobacterium gaetbulicola]
MLSNKGGSVSAMVVAFLLAVSPTISASDYAQECGVETADKVVIGQKESFYAPAANLNFRSRIDTGATRTSMHATNIEIENFSPEAGDNIGKMVNFITANEHGTSVHLREKITHVRQIQNSLGSETRYSIMLDLTLAEREYRVEVNLKDRSLMSDKLLIGRNLLACNYVVDVSKASAFGV